MPKVIQVIESQTKEGAGTMKDAYRTVMVYHTLEGKLLAKDDPCTPSEWEMGRSKRRTEELKKRVEQLEARIVELKLEVKGLEGEIRTRKEENK